MNRISHLTQPTVRTMDECHGWFKDILDAVQPGWIAGGALRDYFSRKPNTSDVDVFFPSTAARLYAMQSLEAAGARKVYSNENLEGYHFKGYHVQLVKHYQFASIEETVDDFDFTVCCAAIGHDGRVVIHEDFFEDLAARRLAVHNLNYPLGTLARIPRYVEKGFKPCSGTLLKLAKAIQRVDLDNPNKNQLQFYSTGEHRFGRFDEADDLSALSLVG